MVQFQVQLSVRERILVDGLVMRLQLVLVRQLMVQVAVHKVIMLLLWALVLQQLAKILSLWV